MNSHYLEYIVVFTISALICVPIAKRFGFGSVLGYLLAGVIIGPFVVGFVGDESKDIQVFAELGVVLMLFLVGLELEPDKLWKIRKMILGTGLSQIVLTTLAIFPILMLIDLTWQAALAVSLAFAMSSTAMVLQYLNEKGLMQSVAGRSSFSVLLMQDVAVIPILALLPLLSVQAADAASSHHASYFSFLPAWANALVVLASVVLVIVFGKYLVSPILKAVSKSKLRELFIAASLMIVIAVSLLMELVGLSPALGAFVAGVVLANSEFKHELESDLEPFKGILLGLFFITVGATINFSHIAEFPLLIIGLTILVMFLKATVLMLISKLQKQSLDQAALFSVGMAQVGEFAFVLLGISLQLQLFPMDTYNTMLSVVAFSMFLSPLFNLVNERWVLNKIGTKEKPEQADDTIEDEHKKVIVVGFSHFGSTLGRFLRANGVEATILDNNSDTVDLLRKMGFKVYYGDASRIDLLKAAGAEQAELLIITIENNETKLSIIENVKKHFPHLKLMVRAKNRFEAYEIMDHGINHVYRETIDTSIRMGVEALTQLGFRNYSAHRAGVQFLKYDEGAMQHLSSFRNNKADYIKNVRQQIQIQEELLTKDLLMSHTQNDHAWDSEFMRTEIEKLSKK